MQSHDECSEGDGKPPSESQAVLLTPEVSTSSLHEGFLERRENPPPPPSSVHGEIDEDDNWSRQLVGVAQESGGEDFFQSNEEDGNGEDGVGETLNDSNDEHRNDEQIAIGDERLQQHVLTPQQPELTLKEKLVLRERQRRIETERARLKRQFALSGNNDEDVKDGELPNDEIHAENITGRNRLHDDEMSGIHSIGDEGTLGEESTRAHPDEEESARDGTRTLGFNMERFLRNSESFCPELATTQEQSAKSGASGDQGVVMERFLKAQMVVSDASDNVVEMRQLNSSTDRIHEEPMARTDATDTRIAVEEHDHPNTEKEPQRSVSFDVDALNSRAVDALNSRSVDRFPPGRDSDAILDVFGDSRIAMVGSNASLVEDIGMMNANTSQPSLQTELSMHGGLTYSASMEMQVDVASSHGDALSNASDEPRVLRLTEADMLEMAAIDEVSIGNAPPSDRDDEEILSEIGELAGFGSNYRIALGDTTISQDTPTTAVESASQHSGHQSQRSVHVGTSVVSNSSVEHLDTLHASDHHSVSGVEGIPSARDPPRYLLSPGAASVAANPPSVRGRDDDIDERSAARDTDGISLHDHEGEHELEVQLIFEETIDRVPELPFGSREAANQVDSVVSGLLNRPRHALMSQSVDESIDSDTQGLVVDGFDFDKNAPRSPFLQIGRSVFVDSIRSLPDDSYTPSERVNLSPLRRGSNGLNVMESTTTQGEEFGYEGVGNLRARNNEAVVPNLPSIGRQHAEATEKEPLIAVSQQQPSNQKLHPESTGAANVQGRTSHPQFGHGTLDKIFNRLRSQNGIGNYRAQDERNAHSTSGIVSKGFSERQIPVLLTIVLELPLLWMISGGLDAGCQRVGRRHYHLLLAFLPLTCAVSGSVGHQSSTLISQVILNGTVTSDTFMTWLTQEACDTTYLAICTGIALGMLGYFACGADFAFGIAICLAQVLSILVAGITGTLTPLFACYIAERDTKRWTVPFVSCLQDIVGCTTMVVISYRILAMLGPNDEEHKESCW